VIKADIGVIGLAVMGQSLVLNLERNNFVIAVYNRTSRRTEEFIQNHADKENIIGKFNLTDFCKSLKRPRKILLMIKAGKSVDDTITELFPLIDEGDIIIDGGNSFFRDTIRRFSELEAKSIFYLGVGISGGEEGALKGPSIMPGGSEQAWLLSKYIFEKIAAKIDGVPCCSYIGSDGAGHYVKMVHNGIEYSDMQLIAETYHIFKEVLNLQVDEIAQIFEEWNKGELNSYLMQITSNIFAVKDEDTGQPLIDVILDTAEQKGTGKWTSQEALEIGVPIPSITGALFARYISSYKTERKIASSILTGPNKEFLEDKELFIKKLRHGLFVAKICSFAQGFSLLKKASEHFKWSLNLYSIASLWRKGCIIRTELLNRIMKAYMKNIRLPNLLLDPYFATTLNQLHDDWRHIIKTAIEHGVPIPAFSSALSYYDSYRSGILPTNLIQAQRDYFGAHGFERLDKPKGEFFHFKSWPEVGE
jgi:6-phosphogluconate dehydrogenase